MERKIAVKDNPEYMISDQGIFYLKNGVASHTKTNRAGYIVASMYKSGTYAHQFVHILVATAFVPNPDKKPYVNHINGIRSDNRAENLEWVTAAENSQRKVFPNNGTRGRRVVELSLQDEFIRIWPSVKEAAASRNITGPSISRCCAGGRPTAAERKWIYLDDYEPAIEGENWSDMTLEDKECAVSSLGRVRLSSGKITKGSLEQGYQYAKL